MHRIVVPWLLVVAMLAVALGAWAMTLDGIVNDQGPSGRSAAVPSFGVRQVYVSANTLGTTLAELPTK